MTAEAKRMIQANLREVQAEEDATQPAAPAPDADELARSGTGGAAVANAGGTAPADDELLDVQIRAIMLQHSEDCKRMHASDAGRLAMELMSRLRTVRNTTAQ